MRSAFLPDCSLPLGTDQIIQPSPVYYFSWIQFAKSAGDHFNRLEWSGSSNNFGVGLPSAEKNEDMWPEKRPFLARQAPYPLHFPGLHHDRSMCLIHIAAAMIGCCGSDLQKVPLHGSSQNLHYACLSAPLSSLCGGGRAGGPELTLSDA